MRAGMMARRQQGMNCGERALSSPSLEGGGQGVGGGSAHRTVRTHPSALPLRGKGSIRGFTLIELMIAIAVLLVVIAATSQIFGTASRVTGVGQATANIMQEAAVIERMMRDDIARLSADGFFAIRQVAVPNNISIPLTGRLLNPTLPFSAMIRADQLLFFADGVSGMTTFGLTGGTSNQSQGTTARIYYGHAFQLPNALPYEASAPNMGDAYDPRVDVTPWHTGNVDLVRTRFRTIAGNGTGTDIYAPTNAMTINGTQPEARKWLFVRQPVALVDDDDSNPNANSKTSYLNNRTARSIFRSINGTNAHTVFGWTNEVRNGRMDGAASSLDEIWRYIREQAPDPTSIAYPPDWPWLRERDVISREAFYYPRAERTAPSAHRVDQALTNHVIGSAVSSFIVEWTWEDGTGDVYNSDGDLMCYDNSTGDVLPCELIPAEDAVPFGFRLNWYPNLPYQPEQPWFGINQHNTKCFFCEDRGAGMYDDNDFPVLGNFKKPESVVSDRSVERTFTGSDFGAPFFDANIRIVEAFFGYNRTRPSAPDPNNDWFDQPHQQLGYTPWPTAIRVTMVLHDPQGRLENGREFQFVIDLPKRVRQ
jgi:prepilin-type N-terminal cleavage/methylation domain-containing protein